MPGYVELHAVGNCRVYLGSSDFAGLMTPDGLGSTDRATADTPISVILKSGSTIDGIHGISPAKLLVYMEGVRLVTKHTGRPLYIVFIDERESFERDLSVAMSVDG